MCLDDVGVARNSSTLCESYSNCSEDGPSLSFFTDTIDPSHDQRPRSACNDDSSQSGSTIPATTTEHVLRCATAEPQCSSLAESNQPPQTSVDQPRCDAVSAPPPPTGEQRRHSKPVATNLKLNGRRIVQPIDDTPLDLSTRRRHRNRQRDNCRPEVAMSQTMTSACLAKLVKQFGTTSATSALTSPGGTNVVDVGQRASLSLDGWTAGRRMTKAVQSTSAFNHPLTTPPSKMSVSTATTLSSAAPSRWRRDSFWASGAWMLVATSTPPDSRPTANAQPSDLHRNRKSLYDHRKSSTRCAARLRKASSCGGDSSGGSGASIGSKWNGSNRAKRKWNSEQMTLSVSELKRRRKDEADQKKGEAADEDSADVVVTATTTTTTTTTSSAAPVRCHLTSLGCGSCGLQFESLYSLTVHLEEANHTPASDVAVLPITASCAADVSARMRSASAAQSPLSSSSSSSSSPSLSAPPQRLVRGQDVWLARGVEQTDRILRCIQCNAAARSLAELTLHMVHTKHYINIVGPPTSTIPSPITAAARGQSAAKMTSRNGLLTTAATGKDEVLKQTMMCCRNCTSDGDDDDDAEQVPVVQHNVTKADKDGSEARLERRHLATSARTSTQHNIPAAFSVKCLISTQDKHTRHPLCGRQPSTSMSNSAVTSPSSRDHSRWMTSSVGPEVTSNSDAPAAVATGVEYDVISA